jgi:hypothetical protein
LCGAWQGVQISPLRFHRYPRKSWGDPTIVPAGTEDPAAVSAERRGAMEVSAEVIDAERNIRIIAAADILYFHVIICYIRFS